MFEIPDFELRYVSDLSEKKLNQVKIRYPQVITTTNYKQILEDKQVKGVVVATPVTTHYPIIMDCLRHGKDVLVEKPLALTTQQADNIHKQIMKTKNVLLVSHTFLYSPPVIKMKEIINSGMLGEVFYIDSSRVNLGLLQPDVSVVWDLGPHDLSVILYWMDQMPVAVSCTGHAYIQPKIQEVAYVTLYWKSGIMAHIHLSWLAPAKLRRMVVIGSNKMVVYDDIEPTEKIKIFDKGVVKNPESFGEFQLTYRSGDIASPKVDSAEPLKMECLDFLKSIQTRVQPKSDITFGKKIVKLLQAAQESVNKNGAIIKIK
jgi:predicted dehydrogenase